MNNNKKLFLLVMILAITASLRFYNLMHDAPYFFDPDERNMANAVSQFRLPEKLSDIPSCIISQFFPSSRNDPGSSLRSNDPGSPLTANCNLNPRFFSYGQFPLYLAFLSDQIMKPFSSLFLNPPMTNDQPLMTNFPSAIFWLRFYSVLSSTFIVLFVFLISKKLLPIKYSLFAAFITAFTPGLIQSAHFGTTESMLTFFFMSSIYFSLKLANHPLSLSRLSFLSNLGNILLLSLSIGLALGSKLTGIFFFVPPFISLVIRIVELFNRKSKKRIVSGLLVYWVIGLLIFVGSILIFFLSSPYNLVAPADFKSAVFGYESDVATGKYEAFYTRQFVNTVPILFQTEKIFPFALGWPVFVLGVLGLLFMSSNIVFNGFLFIFRNIKSRLSGIPSAAGYQVLRIMYKKKININILNTYYLILTTSFLFHFLPNAFLFAKWTRFMTPVLPFFSIFAGYLLFSFRRLHLRGGATSLGYLFYILILTSILPGLMFMSIYTRHDSRVTASKWIYNNIPNNSYILSETANVVDIPLSLPNNETMKQWNNAKVISFDFYHMDENPMIFNDLLGHLQKANYIFIPSRRIFANYPKLPNKYPLTTKYYQLLFSGALGFEKAIEISSFPQLSISQIWPIRLIGNDENAEETSTVFDHPVIRIYRKVYKYSQDQYKSLFTTAKID